MILILIQYTGTTADPAIVKCRLLMIDCIKQTSNLRFRLPPSSDNRLPGVANDRKFPDYGYLSFFRNITVTSVTSAIL
jgi:hypothetical protein